MNSQFVCVVFVQSVEVKERFWLMLLFSNVDKMMVVLVMVIVVYDSCFYEQFVIQFFFVLNVGVCLEVNFEGVLQNVLCGSMLQGVYLIFVVCVLGFDCGFMGGFDVVKFDVVFFFDGQWCFNFFVNIGWGDLSGNYLCGLWFVFEDVVRIV